MESTTETILITGNTYPVKEQLKTLGGRWSKEQKGWLLPKSREAEARSLVASAPILPRGNTGASSSYRPSRCKECGCAPSRYNPIYRSGVCKNCYVSEKEEREMGY